LYPTLECSLDYLQCPGPIESVQVICIV